MQAFFKFSLGPPRALITTASPMVTRQSPYTDRSAGIRKKQVAKRILRKNVPADARDRSADYRRRDAAPRPAADASEVVAEPRIEFGQRVYSVSLVLDRKIFSEPAYLAAAHFKRFWVAHITRMQNV